MSTFSYSDARNSRDKYLRVKKVCKDSPAVDRASFADETLIQDLIRSLKARWLGIYQASDITWRIWAAVLVKMPVHERATAINNPPPLQIISLFTQAPEHREQRSTIQRSFSVVRQINATVLDELTSISDKLNDMQTVQQSLKRKFDALINSFHIQREVIESTYNEMASKELPELPAPAETEAVPDQDDTDHA